MPVCAIPCGDGWVFVEALRAFLEIVPVMMWRLTPSSTWQAGSGQVIGSEDGGRRMMLVIVGGVAGGASAAARARWLDERRITVLNAETTKLRQLRPSLSHRRCHTSRESLLIMTPRKFLKRFNWITGRGSWSPRLTPGTARLPSGHGR